MAKRKEAKEAGGSGAKRPRLSVVRQLSKDPLVKVLTASYPPVDFDPSAIIDAVPKAYVPGTRKCYNLGLSENAGRLGPDFGNERELLQNAYDRAVEMAAGRDVHCERFSLEGDEGIIYGIVSTAPVKQSYGYILYRWEGEKLYTEVTSFSSWLTNQNLDVGDSSKDCTHSIGCFGDGLTSFISALMRRGDPIEVHTLNSTWTFEHRIPEERVGDADPNMTLHQVVSSRTVVRPDLRHLVWGLDDALDPRNYLFIEAPSETFKGERIELLVGEAFAGAIFVKGIYVKDDDTLGVFGLNYVGPAETYVEVKFGRDRNHFDPGQLSEGAPSVLMLQEGEKRERLAEHCLRDLVQTNSETWKKWRPLFRRWGSGFAAEMLRVFLKAYPDGIPCPWKPSPEGLEAFIAAMVGKEFVPVGGRLFEQMKGLTGVPKLADYEAAYKKVLIELDAHPEACGDYARSLHELAEKVTGVRAESILFKTFPERLGDVVLKIQEEGGPELYLVNLTELGKEAIHPDGKHLDGTLLAAGTACDKGCGHEKFLSLLVTKLGLNVSKVIKQLTKSLITPESTGKDAVTADKLKERAANELAERKAKEEQQKRGAEAKRVEAEQQKALKAAARRKALASLYSGGLAGVDATMKTKAKSASDELVKQCLQTDGLRGSGGVAASTVTEPHVDGTSCYELPGLVPIEGVDGRVEILMADDFAESHA